MIKYMTKRTAYEVKARIIPIEVDRETESSVWVDGNRRAKVSESDIYHDTWELAHAHLMAEALRHVDNKRLALERVKGAFGNVKGMKKPE